MPDGSRSLPGRPNLRYLSLRVRGNRTRVVLTSRLIPVNTIADRLQRSWTQEEHVYQPYPTGAQMPDMTRPPVPPSVANAVKAMYAGAAASIIGIVIEIVTVNATKAAIEKRSHNLTVSQVNASEHTLLAGFLVGGLIAVAAWIIIARSCQGGKNWARITGTVLFAIATVDALIDLAGAPVAAAVRIWSVVPWLAGLTAVYFLWQRSSSDFFRRTTPA